MLKSFRITGYLEGISFLILLGIAMPLKYVYGQPEAVKAVGWIHGLLFIAYVGQLVSVSTEYKWHRTKTICGFAAGVLPFGTFVFDWALSREAKGPIK